MQLLGGIILLILVLTESTYGGSAQEFQNSDGTEQEFIYANRERRAAESSDKCSYTFIVPQQKVTGAICVNSKEQESVYESRIHKQEIELLNTELLKQKKAN